MSTLTATSLGIAFVSQATVFEVGVLGGYWFSAFKTDFWVEDIDPDLNRDILNLDRSYFPFIESYAGIGKSQTSLVHTPIKYSDITTHTSPIGL
jgi:hypothetical protein